MLAWEERLAIVEADLAEREKRALATNANPAELAALAAERDRLADERDAIADGLDEAASARDVTALGRDGRASRRDVAAHSRTANEDEGFADRFLSAVDRDSAAGDRADAHDDRAAAAGHRSRAAINRGRAAHDRDAALAAATAHEDEVAGLRQAMKTRNLIGQAQGVLIERYGMDGDEAFNALVRLSQQSDVKLHEVASCLVEVTVAERQTTSRQSDGRAQSSRERQMH